MSTPKHAVRIVESQLADGEQLVALIHTETGKAGPTSGTNTGGSVTRYRKAHDITERGVRGVHDLFDTWLALTDRRLAFFAGSWFTFRPKPKRHLLDLPPDSFTVRWHRATGYQPHRVLHFEFPDDEHLVVMAGDHDDTGRFLAAIGDRAIEVPPPS